jgi:hypothetical protein
MTEQLSDEKISLGRQAFLNLSCEKERSTFLLLDFGLDQQATR